MRWSPERTAWVIGAAGAAARLFRLGSPLTGDEGYMVRHYVAQPAWHIVTHYEVANNHILLSLLLHWLERLSPRALIVVNAPHHVVQLPSLVGSCLALGAAWLAARRRLPAATAAAGLGLLAASYWHLLYSCRLRGYALGSLLLPAAVWLAGRPGPWAAGGYGACLFALHYLVPSNVYFTAPLAVWALWSAKGPARRRLAAATAAAGAATAAAYAPVWRQVLAQSGGGQGTLGERLSEAFLALGSGPAQAGLILALAAVGTALLARRRRTRPFALMLAAMALLPLAATTLQGAVAPGRIYVTALPLLLLLPAAALGEAARRLLPGRRAALAAAAAAVLLGLRETRLALDWEKGRDPRAVLQAASALLAGEDDYVVLLEDPAPPDPAGRLDWEYYAFANRLLPEDDFRVGADVPYLSRRLYLVAAPDAAAARRALEAGAVDPILAGALRERGRFGSLGLYSAEVDAGVLAAYRKAGHHEGLAAEALRRYRFEEALSHAERALKGRGHGPRARYLHGMAAYLLGRLPEAARDFESLIYSPHARLHLADCLVMLNRIEEAAPLYLSFSGDVVRPDAWHLSSRAELARAALRDRGRPGLQEDFGGKQEALPMAKALRDRGTYELAESLARRAWLKDRSLEATTVLADLAYRLRRFVDAERALREALVLQEGDGLRYMLVLVLIEKNKIAEARDELERARSAHPASSLLAQQAAMLSRFWVRGG